MSNKIKFMKLPKQLLTKRNLAHVTHYIPCWLFILLVKKKEFISQNEKKEMLLR